MFILDRLISRPDSTPFCRVFAERSEARDVKCKYFDNTELRAVSFDFML